MPKKVTLELVEPITGHEGPIKTVTVREPTGMEYVALGDPHILARNPDGTIFTAENDKAVESYMQKCVEGDPLLLQQLSLTDAMRVKEKLLGFFLTAREVTSTPKGGQIS